MNIANRFLFCIIILGNMALIAAVKPSTTLDSNTDDFQLANVRYSDVQGVFNAKCVSCHTGPNAARGLRLESWESLIAGSDEGEAIIAYDSSHSLLIELITNLVGGPHPLELDAKSLTDNEISLIESWINQGAPSESGKIPFADADQLLYVANQSEALVSIIDMETNQVVRNVDIKSFGFPENASPHHIAVESDGSYWYLSLIASNTILKLDRQNNLVDRIDFIRPGLLAIDPKSDYLYAGRSMAAVSPPQAIGVIKRSEMTFEEVEIFLPRPHALAVQPFTGMVYTGSLAVNQIASLNPQNEEINLTNLGGNRPHTLVNFAISPDGRWMVGTTELTAKVLIFDLNLSPNMNPVDTIAVNAAPWHPIFTPDGKWVYVGNNRNNTVNVIDMDKRILYKVIEGNGLAQPHGSAISSDGKFVYISNRNLEMSEGQSKHGNMYTPRYNLGNNSRIGTVAVIDTSTKEIIKVIEIEGYGSGMGTAARTP